MPTQDGGVEREPLMSKRLDLLATIILSIAVVGTAYCAWQSTRWSGVQAVSFAQASTARVESSKAQATGVQQNAYDASTFVQIILAYSEGTTETAQKVLDGFTREEFRPAVDDWLASEPFKNPEAARNPFETGYSNAELERARSLEESATAFYNEALDANQTSDDYILATVFFAMVLFFGGVSTKVDHPGSRIAILVMSFLALGGGFLRLLTLPFY